MSNVIVNFSFTRMPYQIFRYLTSTMHSSNLGIGGKYHTTFAGMPTFGLLDPLGIFHLDSEHFGHTSTSLFAFLYKMQSFEHACIFSYCIPKVHNV